MPRFGGFHFAVKIDFERKRGGIENSDAILTGAKVALYFASHLRGKPPFQVFANQSDYSFTSHAHGVPRWTWALDE